MRRDKLTIYRAEDGWRWRYTAPNGEILADSGQAYSRRNAETNLASACREAEAKQAEFYAAPGMDRAKAMEARNAQERFYAAVMRRDRAKAAVAAAEREAAA